MNDIYIEQIDVEKYLNNLLNHTGFNLREFVDKEKELLYEELKHIDNNTSFDIEEKEAIKESAKDRSDIIINEACKTTIWIPPTEKESKAMQYLMDSYFKMKFDKLENDLENRGIERTLVLQESLELTLKDLGNDRYKGVMSDIYHGYNTDDFYILSEFIGLIRFAKEVQRLLDEDSNDNTTTRKPIKWNGKTAALGYIMGLLAENGYIDAPKKRDGEINYNEFARDITKSFEFDGNNIATLAKALNIDNNNMENKNKDLFHIPHIKEIS